MITMYLIIIILAIIMLVVVHWLVSGKTMNYQPEHNHEARIEVYMALSRLNASLKKHGARISWIKKNKTNNIQKSDIVFLATELSDIPELRNANDALNNPLSPSAKENFLSDILSFNKMVDNVDFSFNKKAGEAAKRYIIAYTNAVYGMQKFIIEADEANWDEKIKYIIETLENLKQVQVSFEESGALEDIKNSFQKNENKKGLGLKIN